MMQVTGHHHAAYRDWWNGLTQERRTRYWPYVQYVSDGFLYGRLSRTVEIENLKAEIASLRLRVGI